MRQGGTVRSRARLAAVLAAAWSVPAAMTASQVYLRTRAIEPEASWWGVFLGQLPIWLPWAPLSGLVLLLVRRFPVERGTWRRSLAAHAVAALVIGLLYHALLAPWVIRGEGLPLTGSNLEQAIFGNFVFSAHVTTLTYFGIAAAGSAWANQQRLRIREAREGRLRVELSEARIQGLSARLQPHFLFNALHTVSGLVRAGESAGAVRMLSGLGELLRRSLTADDAQRVPLHEELEALEPYLEIEEVRFGDRLEVIRRIDPGAVDSLVPPLLLQPLVENALRHGIDRDPSAGRVEIAASVQDGTLRLTVRDDGPGPTAGAKERIGLGTTRRRLRLLYGDRARLELRRHPEGGAMASVELPVQVDPGEPGE